MYVDGRVLGCEVYSDFLNLFKLGLFKSYFKSNLAHNQWICSGLILWVLWVQTRPVPKRFFF